MKIFSIKTRLLAVVSLLAGLLILVAAHHGIHQSWTDSEKSSRFRQFNDMADKLLLATSRQALERGITNTLLTHVNEGEPIPSGLAEKIREQRKLGNAYLDEALALAKQIDPSDTTDAFQRRLSAVETAFAASDQLRDRVDEILQGRGTPLAQADWFSVMTALINAQTDLRLMAFSGVARRESAIEINRTLKQAIWLASEYAGQERALVGQAIASARPMAPATRTRLAEKRGIVDINIRKLREGIAKIREMDPQGFEALSGTNGIKGAVQKMEGEFLGRFEDLRERVYASAQDGNYPVSSSEWLKRSTAGIESVLAVNDAVSQYARYQLEQDRSQHHRTMWLAAGLLVFCVVVSVLGYLLTVGIVRRISNVETTVSQAVADKDLTFRIDDARRDELGKLTAAFNGFVESMESLVGQVAEASAEVLQAAGTVADVSRRTEQGIRIQEVESDSVSESINQMMSSMDTAAENSTEAADIARRADDVSREGAQVTRGAIDGINELSSKVQDAVDQVALLTEQNHRIGGIVEVITGIADQTNLLALNAAIEAARAGESGRGFAVVADEVRKLAAGTRESTDEIQNIVKELNAATTRVSETMEKGRESAQQSVLVSEQVGSVLRSITEEVDRIAKISAEVAETNRSQVDLAGGITTNLMANVKQFANLSTHSVQDTALASQQLAEAVTHLQDKAKHYKVSGGEDLFARPIDPAPGPRVATVRGSEKPIDEDDNIELF